MKLANDITTHTNITNYEMSHGEYKASEMYQERIPSTRSRYFAREGRNLEVDEKKWKILMGHLQRNIPIFLKAFI